MTSFGHGPYCLLYIRLRSLAK